MAGMSKTRRSLVIHRVNAEASRIHRRRHVAGRSGQQLSRCCYEYREITRRPRPRSVTTPLLRYRTTHRDRVSHSRDTAGGPVAVADGDSRAHRRRFCPSRPGLATGTSRSHVAVSGWFTGLRVRRRDGHRCWPGRATGRRLDSSQHRRAGYLVNLSSRDAHRRRRRPRPQR